MSSSLILCNDNEPFLHQIVTCDKKWILYGSLVPGLRRSSKALAKAKLALKRVMITAWQSAASLIHYCFLNSSETVTCEKYAQQIDEMHQKLQCLQPALVTERAQFFSMTTPTAHCTTPVLQKSNELGYEVSPHLPWSPDLSPTATTSSSILITFCRENASTTSSRQKMLFKSSLNPEAQIFYTAGINKCMSWWKCVGCNGSYFD